MTCNTNNPLPSIGFLPQPGELKERLTKELFPYSPNFLKNVSIISFDPLSDKAKTISIQKKLEKIVINNLRAKGITVRIEKSVENFLMKDGFSDEEGARRLEPTVKEYILEPLLRFLIKQGTNLKEINLGIKDKSLQVNITPDSQ